MMKQLFRFVTRPTKDGQVDLILGSAFKDQNIIKPNHIYEAIEVLDTIQLREVGPSAIGSNSGDSKLGFSWVYTINEILNYGGKLHLLTVKEFENLINNE